MWARGTAVQQLATATGLEINVSVPTHDGSLVDGDVVAVAVPNLVKTIDIESQRLQLERWQGAPPFKRQFFLLLFLVQEHTCTERFVIVTVLSRLENR